MMETGMTQNIKFNISEPIVVHISELGTEDYNKKRQNSNWRLEG